MRARPRPLARRASGPRRGKAKNDASTLLLLIIIGVNILLFFQIQIVKRSLAAQPPKTSAPVVVEEEIQAQVEEDEPPPPPPPPQGGEHEEAPVPEGTLPSFYGPPVTLGLETCEAYRSRTPAIVRRWAPAGMFNVGTNTLMRLLKSNCFFDGKGRHNVWQAPWGKHNPISWRGQHWAPQFLKPRWQPALETIFPIVVVKDPLSWMKSMCRNHYEAHFKKLPEHKNLDICPSPVAKTPTTVHYQPTKHGQYPSLVHLWRDWYGDYLNVSFPRLIVRFEDLLFDSQNTVATACTCVGGKMRKEFKQAEAQTKDKTQGHRGPVNDRSKALALYGDEHQRYANYQPTDLRFIADALASSPLLDLFHYHFRVDSLSSANFSSPFLPRGDQRRRRR